MTAGPWLFTTSTRTKLLNNTFRLTADTWKCGLVTSSSNISASSTTWAGVTGEHTNANGYLTGGVSVAFSLSGTTDVAVDFTAAPYWLASGGDIVARRAVIYEVGGDVFAFCLLDNSDVNVTTTNGSVLLVGGTPFNLA